MIDMFPIENDIHFALRCFELFATPALQKLVVHINICSIGNCVFLF